jgi:hypothetical protein
MTQSTIPDPRELSSLLQPFQQFFVRAMKRDEARVALSQQRAYAGERPVSDDQRDDKQIARAFGIPKAFRQHATRYGSGVDGIVSARKKYPAALTLDQAAAVRRAERAAR